MRDLAKAYANCGFSYLIQGERDQAITVFTEAIWLQPNGAVAYTNRGVAYVWKDALDRASADLAKARELGFGS